MKIETDRLLLRDYTMDDYEAFYEFVGCHLKGDRRIYRGMWDYHAKY